MSVQRIRPPRGMRAWVSALALAALGAAATASPAIAVPANFWGVSPQLNPSPEQFQRLKTGGVGSVRIPLAWAAVQPDRGTPIDWSGYDVVIGRAAAARIEVLPFLVTAPAWAVPHAVVPGSRGSVRASAFLPVRNAKQRNGWKQFVRQAVLRYGPRGSFWAENPGLPKRPIRTWQIWNEPNFKYFVVRPDPAEYGRLVKLSHAAARGADGGARIVLGGLFARPAEALRKRGPKQAYFATDFLAEMYQRTPGIRSKFHGVALHPYTANFRRLTPYILDFREVLAGHRDAGKGLWVTELGWSSERPTRGNSFAKGPQGQATQLKGAFALLRAKQRPWRIQRLYWFSVDDLKGACNFCDGSGLFREGFVPKPAWHAFVRFAGGRAG